MTIGTTEKSESTAEFKKVISFMKNNIDRIVLPAPNKVVFQYKENCIEVCSLSPNDADLIEYINSTTIIVLRFNLLQRCSFCSRRLSG